MYSTKYSILFICLLIFLVSFWCANADSSEQDDSSMELSEEDYGDFIDVYRRASLRPVYIQQRASLRPHGGKRASLRPVGKRASLRPYGGKRASLRPVGKRASLRPVGKRASLRPSIYLGK